jgi:hypothetical protein
MKTEANVELLKTRPMVDPRRGDGGPAKRGLLQLLIRINHPVASTGPSQWWVYEGGGGDGHRLAVSGSAVGLLEK